MCTYINTHTPYAYIHIIGVIAGIAAGANLNIKWHDNSSSSGDGDNGNSNNESDGRTALHLATAG